MRYLRRPLANQNQFVPRVPCQRIAIVQQAEDCMSSFMQLNGVGGGKWEELEVRTGMHSMMMVEAAGGPTCE